MFSLGLVLVGMALISFCLAIGLIHGARTVSIFAFIHLIIYHFNHSGNMDGSNFKRIGKVKKFRVNLFHILREVNNFACQLISFSKIGEKLLMIILIRAMWSTEHENSIIGLIRFCSVFIVKVCAHTFISRAESCKRSWTFKTQKFGLANLVLGVNTKISSLHMFTINIHLTLSYSYLLLSVIAGVDF